jgi:uncharacterized membrane protein YhaH (DUF805 family)
MSPEEALARRRYYYMTGVNLIATAGAIFGLVIAGRGNNWYASALGGAIIVSALYVMAVVPRAMARRWRTPPEA